MLQEINDVIIRRKKAKDVGKETHDDDPPDMTTARKTIPPLKNQKITVRIRGH